MVKKIIFLSLIIALVGALVIPVISAPAPAEASGTTVSCSSTGLNFRVYTGVPTYLLGIIPLDDGQELTLTLSGSGISGWTVKDDAAWLNENLLFGALSSISSDTRNTDIIVRVNTDGMVAGTYTATITFTITTSNTKKITVPVTVEVIDPAVLGPLCIGLDNDLLTNLRGDETIGAASAYSGITARLLVNPDDALDMQAIQMDGGKWAMDIKCDAPYEDGSINIPSGNLTIEGVTRPIVYGMVAGIGFLISMAPEGMLPASLTTADFGKNYVVIVSTDDDKYYMCFLLGDLPAVLDLIPGLLPLLSGDSSSGTGTDLSGVAVDGTGIDTANAQPSPEMVIPLKPIMKLLPSIMPVMTDLLSNETIIELMKPLMGAIPPIMIIMPMDTLMGLFSGMM